MKTFSRKNRYSPQQRRRRIVCFHRSQQGRELHPFAFGDFSAWPAWPRYRVLCQATARPPFNSEDAVLRKAGKTPGSELPVPPGTGQQWAAGFVALGWRAQLCRWPASLRMPSGAGLSVP